MIEAPPMPVAAQEHLPASQTAGAPTVRFRRLTRAIAYVLSPKVLIGGILVFVVTTGVDAYKTYRTETRSDVSDVRDHIVKQVNPLPPTAVDTTRAIANIQTLFTLYESEAARGLVAKTIGYLSDLKSRQESDERKSAEAIEAQRLAAEAAARSEAAKRLEEAARRAQAADAERIAAEENVRREALAAEQARAQAQRQAEIAQAARVARQQSSLDFARKFKHAL